MCSTIQSLEDATSDSKAVADASVAAAHQFWKHHFECNPEPLNITVDQGRTYKSYFAPRNCISVGPTPAALQRTGRVLNGSSLTTGAVLLAAFHAYLCRITSQSSIALGVQPAALLNESASELKLRACNHSARPAFSCAVRQSVVSIRSYFTCKSRSSDAGSDAGSSEGSTVSKLSSCDSDSSSADSHCTSEDDTVQPTSDQQRQQDHEHLVPLCCQPFHSRDSLLSHATRLQSQLRKIAQHSALPLTDILAAANVSAPDNAQHPAFQAAVVIADDPAAGMAAAAGLDVALLLVPEVEGSYELLLVYNQGLISDEGGAMMALHFEVFLLEAAAGFGATAAVPLMQAPLMNSEERSAILDEFNSSEQQYSASAQVHGSFAAWAKARGASPCVVADGCVWCYREVDSASNRIAHYLRNVAGVGRGSVVGVLMRRSPLLVAALLGVLKSGAAYLPLDWHSTCHSIEVALRAASAKAVVAQHDLLHKLPSEHQLTSLGIHTLRLHPDNMHDAAHQLSISEAAAVAAAPAVSQASILSRSVTAPAGSSVSSNCVVLNPQTRPATPPAQHKLRADAVVLRRTTSEPLGTSQLSSGSWSVRSASNKLSRSKKQLHAVQEVPTDQLTVNDQSCNNQSASSPNSVVRRSQTLNFSRPVTPHLILPRTASADSTYTSCKIAHSLTGAAQPVSAGISSADSQPSVPIQQPRRHDCTSYSSIYGGSRPTTTKPFNPKFGPKAPKPPARNHPVFRRLGLDVSSFNTLYLNTALDLLGVPDREPQQQAAKPAVQRPPAVKAPKPRHPTPHSSARSYAASQNAALTRANVRALVQQTAASQSGGGCSRGDSTRVGQPAGLSLRGLQRAAFPDACYGAAAEQPADWQLGQLGGPEDACCVIYNGDSCSSSGGSGGSGASGSSFDSKGTAVAFKHKGLTAYTSWFRAHHGITASDVFILQQPLNTTAGADELWTALTAGAAVVLAPEQADHNLHDLLELVSKYGVTTLTAPAHQVLQLSLGVLTYGANAAAAAVTAAAIGSSAAAGQPPCASLLRVICRGGLLTSAAALDLAAALPYCELHNSYGCRAAIGAVTTWHCKAPSEQHFMDALPLSTLPATTPCMNPAAIMSIGKPIGNSKLYILDDSLQPVPIGVPGQLYIGGVAVAAGLCCGTDSLNPNPRQGNNFLQNPFSHGRDSQTEILYRTGDRARWIPAAPGTAEFGAVELLSSSSTSKSTALKCSTVSVNPSRQQQFEFEQPNKQAEAAAALAGTPRLKSSGLFSSEAADHVTAHTQPPAAVAAADPTTAVAAAESNITSSVQSGQLPSLSSSVATFFYELEHLNLGCSFANSNDNYCHVNPVAIALARSSANIRYTTNRSSSSDSGSGCKSKACTDAQSAAAAGRAATTVAAATCEYTPDTSASGGSSNAETPHIAHQGTTADGQEKPACWDTLQPDVAHIPLPHCQRTAELLPMKAGAGNPADASIATDHLVSGCSAPVLSQIDSKGSKHSQTTLPLSMVNSIGSGSSRFGSINSTSSGALFRQGLLQQLPMVESWDSLNLEQAVLLPRPLHNARGKRRFSLKWLLKHRKAWVWWNGAVVEPSEKNICYTIHEVDTAFESSAAAGAAEQEGLCGLDTLSPGCSSSSNNCGSAIGCFEVQHSRSRAARKKSRKGQGDAGRLNRKPRRALYSNKPKFKRMKELWCWLRKRL